MAAAAARSRCISCLRLVSPVARLDLARLAAVDARATPQREAACRPVAAPAARADHLTQIKARLASLTVVAGEGTRIGAIIHVFFFRVKGLDGSQPCDTFGFTVPVLLEVTVVLPRRDFPHVVYVIISYPQSPLMGFFLHYLGCFVQQPARDVRVGGDGGT